MGWCRGFSTPFNFPWTRRFAKINFKQADVCIMAKLPRIIRYEEFRLDLVIQYTSGLWSRCSMQWQVILVVEVSQHWLDALCENRSGIHTIRLVEYGNQESPGRFGGKVETYKREGRSCYLPQHSTPRFLNYTFLIMKLQGTVYFIDMS